MKKTLFALVCLSIFVFFGFSIQVRKPKAVDDRGIQIENNVEDSLTVEPLSSGNPMPPRAEETKPFNRKDIQSQSLQLQLLNHIQTFNDGESLSFTSGELQDVLILLDEFQRQDPEVGNLQLRRAEYLAFSNDPHDAQKDLDEYVASENYTPSNACEVATLRMVLGQTQDVLISTNDCIKSGHENSHKTATLAIQFLRENCPSRCGTEIADLSVGLLAAARGVGLAE